MSDTLPIDTEEKTRIHSHEHTENTHNNEDSTAVDTLETSEIPSRDVYDWRDDNVFDSLHEKTDPWSQIYQDGGEFSNDDAKNSEDEETYPPLDWYKTKDPELRAEYLYAQLIKQFGDTPEVQAIGEYEIKAAQGIPPTLDEYIEFLEAHVFLWPNDTTLRTIKEMRRIKAGGENIIFKGRPQ